MDELDLQLAALVDDELLDGAFRRWLGVPAGQATAEDTAYLLGIAHGLLHAAAEHEDLHVLFRVHAAWEDRRRPRLPMPRPRRVLPRRRLPRLGPPRRRAPEPAVTGPHGPGGSPPRRQPTPSHPCPRQNSVRRGRGAS